MVANRKTLEFLDDRFVGVVRSLPYEVIQYGIDPLKLSPIEAGVSDDIVHR